MTTPVAAPAYDMWVTIGTLTASMGHTVNKDDRGNRWIFDTLDGWFDGGIDIRADPIERAHQSGDIDGPAYDGSRIITIGGLLEAASRAELRRCLVELNAICSRGAREVLTIRTDGSSDDVSAATARQVVVRRDSAPRAQPVSQLTARWELTLYTPDPNIYGVELVTATTGRYLPGGGFTFPTAYPINFGTSGGLGTAVVNNLGDTDTWPILRFAGPLYNPIARNVSTGQVFSYVGVINAGDQVVVDMRNRRVLLGTTSRRNRAGASQFWSMPPGYNEIFFEADGGGGTLTVEYRDAWS